MTMVTGEMDYESIFRQSSSGTTDPDPPLPFPEISYLLWIVFLVMIPILLGNLLVWIPIWLLLYRVIVLSNNAACKCFLDWLGSR
jgi:hypothetical protein